MRQCPRCGIRFDGNPGECPDCGLSFRPRRCPKCGTIDPDRPLVCTKCGSSTLYDQSGTGVESPSGAGTADPHVPEFRGGTGVRYLALRAIASLYYVAGAVVVVTAGLVGGFAAVKQGEAAPIAVIGAWVLGGLVGAITLFAAAESIKVFVDIEENTRRAAEAICQLVHKDREAA